MHFAHILKILYATGVLQKGSDSTLLKRAEKAIAKLERNYQFVYKPNKDWSITKRGTAASQAWLNEQGYDAGVVDGVYGDNTRRAYIAWENGDPIRAKGIALEDLKAIAGIKEMSASHSKTAQGIADALNENAAKYGVTHQQDLADLLAHAHVESGGFEKLSESFWYTTSTLMRTFGRHRISAADCKKYGGTKEGKVWIKKPNHQALANILYGSLYGNQNFKGGGWKYRGGGPGQCTFHNNYALATRLTGIDFVNNPGLMRNPYEGTVAMLALWQHWGMNSYTGGSVSSRKKWNGGDHGLKKYQAAYKRADARRLSVPEYSE